MNNTAYLKNYVLGQLFRNRFRHKYNKFQSEDIQSMRELREQFREVFNILDRLEAKPSHRVWQRIFNVPWYQRIFGR